MIEGADEKPTAGVLLNLPGITGSGEVPDCAVGVVFFDLCVNTGQFLPSDGRKDSFGWSGFIFLS